MNTPESPQNGTVPKSGAIGPRVDLLVHFYSLSPRVINMVSRRYHAQYGHMTTEVNGALYNIDVGKPGGWYPAQEYHEGIFYPDISMKTTVEQDIDFPLLDSLANLVLDHKANLRYLRDYSDGKVYRHNKPTCTTSCRKILGSFNIELESHIPDTILQELKDKQWQTIKW